MEGYFKGKLCMNIMFFFHNAHSIIALIMNKLSNQPQQTKKEKFNNDTKRKRFRVPNIKRKPRNESVVSQ